MPRTPDPVATQPAAAQPGATVRRSLLPRIAQSLSARLLVLTVFFVMLSEILIYAPSIGRFRLSYLAERLAAGHLATLAVQATPDFMVSPALQQELLNHAGAYMIALTRPDGIRLMLTSDAGVPKPDLAVDLHEPEFFPAIGEAFATLAQRGNRILRVQGPSPKHPQAMVTVLIDEAPLRAAMLGYSQRILALSIVISLITAALVYLTLHWLLVRPMRRLTDAIVAFRDDPEDAFNTVPPTERADEIGTAQRALAEMQQGLRTALQQKTRLAALGTAVTKINHDLRGILATARLVSDRLVTSDDPEVRRTTPTLLAAIDRAVDLCSKTLTFTREGPPPVSLSRFPLRPLLDEVGAVLVPAGDGDRSWAIAIEPELQVEADRGQLFRVLCNLGQNALQAGASRVSVHGAHTDGQVIVEVHDNGPGLPPRARDNLFQPFAGSGRPGGSGLGLVIARELMRAQGGELRLVRSTAEGSVFALQLPDRPSA